MLACAYMFASLDQVSGFTEGTKLDSFEEFGGNLRLEAEKAHSVHRLTNHPKVGYKYSAITYNYNDDNGAQ